MRTWVQKLGDAYMHWFSGNWMLQDCKDREHHQTTLSLPKGASEKDLLEHEFDRTGYFPSIVSRLGIVQGVHKFLEWDTEVYTVNEIFFALRTNGTNKLKLGYNVIFSQDFNEVT
uniref:Uncharacterized protein n=1 Tax=Rhizophagus irregularis (strain DAOM 181602 / DAOM 197198 / MUCL 43194) TaxID=747089 RepID=U9US89_RHIID